MQLADLGVWYGGGTPRKSNPAFWNGEIPWVSPKDVKVERLYDSQDHITGSAIEASATTMIAKRSVLLVTRSGILAHTLPVATNVVPLTINQDLKAITPCAGIDAEFLASALRAFQRHILKECSKHGTTVHSIEVPRLQAFSVPVAPTQEQRRIVSKIEELFSELDKGVESLKTARAQLKLYRQAVLKHAFEGKLTAQWREENKDQLEKPEQLLARIEQEREAQYERLLREWKADVKTWEEGGKLGKRPTRPPKLRKSSQPLLAEAEILPPLPGGWAYLRLGLVIDEPKYGTSKKCDYNYEGTAVLRIPNVVRGVVDASDLKGAHFAEPEKRTYALRNGDILVIRSNGSISIVGKCAIISKGEEQYLFAGYLIRLRSNPVALLPDYLAALLSSHLLRTQIEDNAKSTSGVNNINSSEIKSLIVPLCSLSEQEVLVERLSANLSEIDAIESDIDNQLLKASALRQSILKTAFAGQLVGQDPGDEPASILLDRIKAEKKQASESRETSKRIRKKKSAA